MMSTNRRAFRRHGATICGVSVAIVMSCLMGSAANAAEPAVSPPSNPRSRAFNVLDYGAVGDGTTDNLRIGVSTWHMPSSASSIDVFINTEVYNVRASEPVHGTAGLITPAANNAAWTVLRNLTVTGYDTGIVVNEHTDGDNIVLRSNIHGLRFAAAHHASRLPGSRAAGTSIA